ncbi:MAG: SDR family NAD(P)-dependent oxidoreductase [Candidatus Baltobacteraceae bacterium]
MTSDNDHVEINLSGKVVLVTGGSLGIGFAAAEACLAAGGSTFICARGAHDLADATTRLQSKYGAGRAFGITADISLRNNVTRLFDEVDSKFGRIDGVIHAAGIYGPIGTVADVEPDAWMEVLRVNLFGSFLVTREACRHMRERDGGRIVLLSGGGAATPFPNYTGYACSKVGVVRLTETVAQEMSGANIEINCLAPGFVATRLHEQTLASGAEAGAEFYQKTQALLEEGAVPASVGGRAAAFLVSEAANGITGKFVAAPYDGWGAWSRHLEELRDSDLFTLRRIVPKDRGLSWQ